MRRLWPAVAAVFFALYARAVPPSVASYRDAGEMASSAWTLGVSHPTSYPLYILLARLSQNLPVGNPAYRLNLLSAAAAALAVAAVGLVASLEWGWAAGLSGALLLGLNPVFFSTAVVQEMYGVWLLALASLLGLALSLRRGYSRRVWLGFAFLFGLALGNRLDLLLCAPGLVWLALSEKAEPGAPVWAGAALILFPAAMLVLDTNAPIVLLIVGTALWRAPASGRARWAALSLAAAVAGLSVYLYLPVRSATGPWLDWNHPADWPNFVESILRTRYGGTLDLLSKSYDKGELFGPNMLAYGRHLWDAFGPLGLAAAAAGCAISARREPRRWLGQLAVYWWCGPVFLLIANMPTNPHAAAIVEPHYLLSDCALVFWAAEGVGAASGSLPSLAPWGIVLALGVIPFARGLWARENRRDHYFGADFARAAFSAARPGSALVAKKDVPLYTLWYHQTAQGLRPDVRVVAQGLAGSRWYQASWRRRDPSLFLAPLSAAPGWKGLLSGDAAATPDAELPPELASSAQSRGLLSAWSGEPGEAETLWSLAARRGDYRYEAQPDFFASDVVEEFAQAALRLGSQQRARGELAAARESLLSSWAMHFEFPDPPALLGFEAYARGAFAEALGYYVWAADLSDRLVGLAGEYRALPAVRESIRRQAAGNRAQLGVVLERLGRGEEAAAQYRAALERYPLAQAHFNLAVLAWNRDWDLAQRELELAVALDPGHADAARYLAQLKARRSSGALRKAP